MKNILIVDDDESVRFILQTALEKMLKFAVSTAEDGIAGINAMQNREIDLVITDLNMPRMDGFELIREIRSHFPKVRIIVISGCDDLEKLIDSKCEGNSKVDYMFSKPFTVKEIILTVKKLL